jgi:cbb3-type cytochrome oxidase subunit 3
MILAILIGLVFVAAFVYIIWVRKKERTRQKTNIYFDFPSGELFDKLDC